MPTSAFIQSLRKASFRGVPFSVQVADGAFGRRLAVHEYPYRDKPWLEDLGEAARRYNITGYLITDSATYSGGDVLQQLQKLIAAAVAKGNGTLVHPLLGNLTVAVPEGGIKVIGEWDKGRVIGLQMQFIEDGSRTFPTVSPAAKAQNGLAALAANVQAALSYTAKVQDQVLSAVAAVQNTILVAKSWAGQFNGLAIEATQVSRLAASLPGQFGRFFGGNTQGGFSLAPASALPAGTTFAQIAQQAAAQRGAVVTAAQAFTAAVDGSVADYGAAAGQALVAATAATCADPADQIRLLSRLSSYDAPGLPGITGAGSALSDLMRRAVATALAQASAAYQPRSFDDAVQVLQTVASQIQALAVVAADQKEDAVYTALKSLRASVVQDLRSRGADLSPIKTFDVGEPLPSLALAQKLYADPTRADGLVTQIDPVSPLFCGPSFQALAS